MSGVIVWEGKGGSSTSIAASASSTSMDGLEVPTQVLATALAAKVLDAPPPPVLLFNCAAAPAKQKCPRAGRARHGRSNRLNSAGLNKMVASPMSARSRPHSAAAAEERETYLRSWLGPQSDSRKANEPSFVFSTGRPLERRPSSRKATPASVGLSPGPIYNPSPRQGKLGSGSAFSMGGFVPQDDYTGPSTARPGRV